MNKSSKLFIDNLNIYDGTITYNDFEIDESLPFSKQKWSYKMDILQIEFGPRYVLDVGWHPEFDPKGYFLVQAIQDYDWINSLIEIKCNSLSELKKGIEQVAALLSLKNAN